MSKKVKIYTIKHSEHCEQASYWLQDHKIDFDEVSLEDDDRKEELLKITGQLSAPTLVIEMGDDTEIVIGFEPDKYAKKLIQD